MSETNPLSVYGNSGWELLYLFLTLIISITVMYGYILATLKAARGEKPTIIDLFKPFKKLITIVVSGILLGLIVGIGFMLFMIPGVFFSCRFAFVPYLIVDQNKGIFSSISGSWKMTKGHFWKIFLLGLTILGINTILFTIYYVVTLVTGGGNLFYGNISNMWAYQIFFILISLPVVIFFFLLSAPYIMQLRLK